MKNILITGGTSGIGLELIKLLAKRNYNIIFFARSKSKSEKVKAYLEKKNNITVDYLISDFGDLNSIKKATDELIDKNITFDCLINNAGKVYFSYGKTKDNIERSFQINYLSHFFISEKLIKENMFSKNSQIINISSVAHNPKSSINSLDSLKFKKLVGKINFKDINYEKEKFRGFTNIFYSRSKMAQIMWSYHRSKFKNHTNINALHPGLLGTNVIFENGILGKILTPLFKLFFRSSKDGAENILFVMDKVFKENLSGRYFDETKISDSHEFSYNLEDQKKLFDLSNNMLNEREIT